MPTKKCYRCKKIKDVSLFYIYTKNADGYYSYCKHCAKIKARAREHDPAKKEELKKYYKERNQRPERKKYEYLRNLIRREKSPGKYKAHTKLNNALKNGIVVRTPCSICGDTKAEAHHPDYRKYLFVVWLCSKHHKEVHKGVIPPFVS